MIDPFTFEKIFVKIYPGHESELRYKDLPKFMIHPKEGGWFMFEDELDAIIFKLTYL